MTPILNQLRRRQPGFTLLETLFYIALFTLLFAIIIQTLLTIGGTHQRIAALKHINDAGLTGMERLVREVRDADHIVLDQSDLGVTDGRLTLAYKADDTDTRSFYLAEERLYLDRNGVKEGPLTSRDARVTALTFHRVNATSSEAVRIELAIEATSTDRVLAETFYNTAILRGSYRQ